ncbi:hypothetical protein COT75_04175 [Candidatus Beckwithbacteria bacterium CG10_big_fil_rev_8_21_14_0_10_34_10]|uniref:Uncharacterized protein n=1 Tax=Candidatus Beckwithbacteria bacterium CG10_big_fil_rev_8_21_14_0_10_34_10 TaxID=1974495 RepID=A0A2H0WAI3_9BACT|nr:MAG: hypothetical protein COT75_04175 [Candidatus Beckwithbacteria bacterium CG10_big_fil_rev_8_21_14_0_10_34_10]
MALWNFFFVLKDFFKDKDKIIGYFLVFHKGFYFCLKVYIYRGSFIISILIGLVFFLIYFAIGLTSGYFLC